MPLYIKDPEVDKLTEELIGLTKTSKVEAVKTALKHEIAKRKEKLSIRARLAKTLAMAREAGLAHDEAMTAAAQIATIAGAPRGWHIGYSVARSRS